MKISLSKIFIVVLLFFFSASMQIISQQKTIIEGTVINSSGNPIPYVNIFLLDKNEGSTSDDDGSFFFRTTARGEVILMASSVGYEKQEKKLILNGDKIELKIVLKEIPIKLKELVVTGSSFGSEKEKGLVISRIDIVTTPGGAADIYQALKTLPGLTQVSESAELYVRGGDPIETVTMIDGAALYHPFTFESAYGGLFSNLSQSVVKGMYFSSGGFSTKYGNALSGVLDIETKNQTENTKHQIGISMANISLTTELPLISNKLGAYLDVRQSFTKPIFWLNGGNDRMVVAPISGNATGGLVYSYSNTGRFKLFGIASKDEQGVKVERAEYNGIFNGNTKNYFLNLTHSNLLTENIMTKSSVAYNTYSNSWRLGSLDLEKTEKVYSTRHDFEFTLSPVYGLHAGIDAEFRNTNFVGVIPQEEYDIRPEGNIQVINAGFSGSRFGFYSELISGAIFGLSDVSFTGGVRYDVITQLKVNWIDPRAAIAYKINESSSVRFGWGIYHQLPDPKLFRSDDGNPNLRAMNAEHFILSFDKNFSDFNSFRVEVYHKKYKDLPKENSLVNFDNSGFGFANGIDLILKSNIAGIDGWISYGYIDTKRNWMDFDKDVNSSFDITHNITLVAKYNITNSFQIGMNAKYATGRPFTPINGSVFNAANNLFEPIYGLTNSARYPDYKRLDIRLTYFDQVFDYPVIAYIEGLNIFNINNIFGYTYTPDYSKREDIESYFGRRMVVIGAMINIGGV
ncbi:MAG: TonB-dependent receptor [Ignavibacteria bacterium]|nr:TonB-dependent receptor [Ignavibacteria bacterium]